MLDEPAPRAASPEGPSVLPMYAPPRATSPASSLPPAERLRRKAWLFLLISGATWFGGLVAASLTLGLLLGPAVLVTGGVCLAGVVVSVRAVVATFREPAAGSGEKVSAVMALVVNMAMTAFGTLSTLLLAASFTRGRQIRRRGRVLLPPVEEGAAWTTTPLGPVVVDDAVRAGVAAQWRENGRTEHASVAAFARHTLDLVALGAPPELIAASQRDALDETHHAELCFALARAIDGAAESPGRFVAGASVVARSSIRVVALADLAVDSLVDGALNEGASARIVAKLARRVEDPVVRGILRRIAADEGRHAAHGWHVVRWCLAEGGPPVASAVRAAARALPRQIQGTLSEGARAGAWERWGIPGEVLEREELESTRLELVRRVEALLAEPTISAAATRVAQSRAELDRSAA